MTAVKSEPTPETVLPAAQNPACKGASVNSSDEAHNRQALANKPINHAKGGQNREKEMQMRKIESFLLKPGQITTAKDIVTSSVKKEREQTSPAKDALEPVTVAAAVPTPKSTGPTKRPAQESPLKPPKKRELNEKFKELSHFVEVEREEHQSENPGPYEPIDKLLYETRGEESEPLFQDLEQQSERNFCSQAASWSLQEWIEQGQQVLDTHTRLIGRLVQHRIELSLKLQVITSAVNDRAAALNEQGLLVDQKLARIKTLGEEILHII